MLIITHNQQLKTITKQCAHLDAKRVLTFGLTPFDSITGNNAYQKKLNKHFREGASVTELIHVPTYCENEQFIAALTDRAKTGQT